MHKRIVYEEDKLTYIGRKDLLSSQDKWKQNPETEVPKVDPRGSRHEEAYTKS